MNLNIGKTVVGVIAYQNTIDFSDHTNLLSEAISR